MNRILAIILFCLVIGCNAGSDIPKGILPPQEMQYIMWDMVQADGLATNSLDTLMRRPSKRMELYKTVLITHKISQEALRKNIQFYESRPDLLKIVLDSLQQMSLRDTATIEVKPHKAAPDSVTVDTTKAKTDTSKVKIDSIKARKLKVPKFKALKIASPV